MKNAFEKLAVTDTASLLFNLVDAPRRPRMHWRIYIAKGPFVSGKLAVRVHVPLTQQEYELLFGKLGINQSQRHTMKCEVPRRIPGILPLVRHRDYVRIVEMAPFMISPIDPLGRWIRSARVAFEPLLHDIVIKLLGPEQAAKGLTHYCLRIGRKVAGNNCFVELVCFANTLREDLIEVSKNPRIPGGGLAGESQANGRGFPRLDGQ